MVEHGHISAGIATNTAAIAIVPTVAIEATSREYPKLVAVEVVVKIPSQEVLANDTVTVHDSPRLNIVHLRVRAAHSRSCW